MQQRAATPPCFCRGNHESSISTILPLTNFSLHLVSLPNRSDCAIVEAFCSKKVGAVGRASTTTMGRLHLHWAALIGCLLLSAHGVEAIAQFVLKNGGNKCIKVDITRDLVVLVDYVAPDLQLVNPEENEAMKRRSMTGRDGDEEDPELVKDGLDSRYNARNRPVVRSSICNNDKERLRLAMRVPLAHWYVFGPDVPFTNIDDDRNNACQT